MVLLYFSLTLTYTNNPVEQSSIIEAKTNMHSDMLLLPSILAAVMTGKIDIISLLTSDLVLIHGSALQLQKGAIIY